MTTPVSVGLFFQQLACSAMFFPFEKLLLNVRLFLQTTFLITSDMTMLQCWTKFSNGLVRMKYQDDLCQKLQSCD